MGSIGIPKKSWTWLVVMWLESRTTLPWIITLKEALFQVWQVKWKLEEYRCFNLKHNWRWCGHLIEGRGEPGLSSCLWHLNPTSDTPLHHPDSPPNSDHLFQEHRWARGIPWGEGAIQERGLHFWDLVASLKACERVMLWSKRSVDLGTRHSTFKWAPAPAGGLGKSLPLSEPLFPQQ